MTLNDYLMSFRNVDDENVYLDISFPLATRITCKDGFSISVQATHGAYCRPRRNIGPWYQVECGFPSARPDGIMTYADDPERPTETVYGYVPIEDVERLLEAHGGAIWPEPAAPTTPIPIPPAGQEGGGV